MKNIEFIALPGAGKSTIRQLLIKQLKENHPDQWITVEEAFYLAARKNIDAHMRLILNITPMRHGLKLISKIYNRSQWQQEAQSTFLANHGKAFSYILTSEAYNCSSISDRQKGINAFLGIGSQRQCIQDHGFANKNILYDEGLIQKSLIFIPTNGEVGPGSPDDSNNIYNYLKNIPKPDILIFIKIDIETSLQRMRSRPDGLTERLQVQGEKQILSFLSRSKSHLEKTASCLLEENDVKIITIENNSSPEVAVKSIISGLNKP